MPASIRSYARSSSHRHQSTFWTLTELGRPQIVIRVFALLDTLFAPPSDGRGNNSISGKKQPVTLPLLRLRNMKNQARDERGLISQCVDRAASVSEEQPQQDDHRNWHTEKPEQNASSHSRLLHVKQATPKSARCSARSERPGLRMRSEVLVSYQWPVLGIEAHGSAAGFASPFCKSSTECRSGERTKAICPSRGGRLIVTPIFISRSQVA